MPLACFDANRKLSTHHPTCRRHVSTLWRYRFGKFDGLFTKKIFYHQGFFAVKRRAVFILLAMPPTSLERATLGLWCDWFKPLLEIRHAAALTTGAKHWHRQKAVFYVFVFLIPPTIPATMQNLSPGMFH